MGIWKPPRVSDYTPPSELCPHPEWWSCWNSVSTEVEVSILVASLVQATQPEFVVEVGAHYGQTTERIGKILMENGHGQLVALEIDHGLHGSAMARCWMFENTEWVKILEMDSLQYIPPKPINFLFVDGAVNRLADVKHYRQFMAPRSIMVIHDTAHSDYTWQVPEILSLCGGNEHIQLDTPRGVLIIKLP